MVYICEDGTTRSSYEPTYRNDPVSNVRYDGDRFKVDANMNTTGTVCFIGGCVVGAVVACYILNSLNKNS